jgi:hypothetical protein
MLALTANRAGSIFDTPSDCSIHMLRCSVYTVSTSVLGAFASVRLKQYPNQSGLGIQPWGKASTSYIEILERFQSKALRMIVDAPWYVPNTVIRRDLQITTVKEKNRRYSSQYSACLSAHPNDLIVNLTELPDNRR